MPPSASTSPQASNKPPLPPNSSSSSSSSSSSPSSSWTPKPIRILFSKFPLQTLPANRLPSRSLSLSARKRNTLFLFTTAAPEDEKASLVPSFNPTCLKWQTYLLMRGIEFGIRPSSNHASPSGSLPFLIRGENASPGAGASAGTGSKEKRAPLSSGSSSSSSSRTISTSGLQAWLSSQTQTNAQQERDEETGLQEAAFLSLIDHRLRPAWLHAFYLTPNLHSLAVPLYIHSTTTSTLVRSWQTNQLHAAALAEVQKIYPLIGAKEREIDVLYATAGKALEALDATLGEADWFFGAQEPGMLDAAVFAYTCLVLDEALGLGVAGRWDDRDESRRLQVLVDRCDRLRRHRDRVLARYFT